MRFGGTDMCLVPVLKEEESASAGTTRRIWSSSTKTSTSNTPDRLRVQPLIACHAMRVLFIFICYNLKMQIDKYQKAKYIFVVGIGGSDLASKAVWSAMTLHKTGVEKKLFFLESPDIREYTEISNFVKNEVANLEEVVLVVISKSGKTAETLETYHKTFDILSEKFGSPISERVLIISSLGSTLWQLAEKNKIETIPWPEEVGGRWSAFTAPHTTVLSIAGLDAEAFVSSGKEMDIKCSEETEDNPAKHLAKNIYDNYEKGFDILDFFIFNSELEDLGKWCRQLIAESLGKENEEGERVGLTPTVSIGPVDMHSMLQLNLGGPKNRFTIFVKSFFEIKESINDRAYEEVSEAYKEAGLPFIKYEIEKINEREIGSFMAYMMNVTLELAKLFKVDPYGQPAVENYKKSLHNL